MVTDGIRHDPTNAEHVDLVERCARIAALQGTKARDVLKDTSTTLGGAAITDGCLVGMSASWLAITIATCERVEAELLEESDDEARDS